MAHEEASFEAAYRRHADTVYRVCILYLKNAADAEDAAQTAFLKLWGNRKPLNGPEHEKAWLIVTASNVCKNMLRSRGRSGGEAVALPASLAAPEERLDETLAQVLALPEKYKLALYLHYYEGYKTAEIAQMTRAREATVRSWLHRGRELLKLSIKEDAE